MILYERGFINDELLWPTVLSAQNRQGMRYLGPCTISPRIGDHAGIGGRSGHNVGCDWGFNGGVGWGCGSDLVRHSSLRSRIS